MKQRGFARGFGCTIIFFVAGSCARQIVPPSPPPPQPVPTALRPAESAAPGGFSFQGALSQGGLLLGTAPPRAVSLTLDGAAIPVESGRFLVGFGRDHGPSALLEARLADGSVIRDALAIAPRAWQVDMLSIPKGTSAPSFPAIRDAELAQINAARRIVVSSDGWQQRFLWPATGRISTRFGSPL